MHCLSLQEMEISTLQTALQALSASSIAPQQPEAQAHAAAVPQPNSGVFCPQVHVATHSATHSLPADKGAHGPFQDLTPSTRLQQTQQQSTPRKGQRPEGRFQYPEDTPPAGQQVAGHKPQAVNLLSSTCRQQDQHSPAQKEEAPGHCHGQQGQPSSVTGAPDHCHGQYPAAYTVEEPDSPAQPASTGQNGVAGEEPTWASGRTAAGTRNPPPKPPADPPAGCLYQDTTIRRVTTPLKNGKVTGTWAHHEEITVRQVRQINQSEARLHRLPPLSQPHVVQGNCSDHLPCSRRICFICASAVQHISVHVYDIDCQSLVLAARCYERPGCLQSHVDS